MVEIMLVVVAAFACIFLWKMISCCYLNPLKALNKLTSCGFTGPKPRFPFGNLKEMMKMCEEQETLDNKSSETLVPPMKHDIYQSHLPYFAHWQQSYGKVFIYWMGTEPFLYVADPEFLKQISGEVAGKDWGKSIVLRSDREGLTGNFGLNVTEGSDWVRHKHIINRAFSFTSLKRKTNSTIECTKKLMNQWRILVDMSNSSSMEIDVQDEIVSLMTKIMIKTNFSIGSELGAKALNIKLRSLAIALYKDPYKHYIGVPFGQLICLRQTLEKRRLGKEVDRIFMSIVTARRKLLGVKREEDLLGLLLEDSETKLTNREILDECKTLFAAGYMTVPPLITWTLMLLAMNPRWQVELRAEIKDIVGDGEIDLALLVGLKKVGWVMNEVLRLYSSELNCQRQTLRDIRVGKTLIPKGTNIWIDILSMHHDRGLWGDDVHEFKPERFREDPLYGRCAHKMGYLPFGFGGRMCAGRNYATMVYKIVLSLMLTCFSFSVSPSYKHCPTSVFNFEPMYGMPLIVQHLGKH